MIKQLRAPRGAYFFRRRARITNEAIRTLFVQLQRETVNPSRPIFRVERAKFGDARYSAICFSYERPVSFLEGGATDRVHGFLLLVEKDEIVALFKSALDLTGSFRRAYLDPIGRSRVERAIARHDAVFERLSLRNMTTSRFALRSKTLEARDLENAIAASSASRYIPQGYRVRRPDGSYSATPSTGRIAVRADKADYSAIVEWACQIIELLKDDNGETSAFIRNFARFVDLSLISADVFPTFFAVDTMALADAIFEAEEPIRLVRQVAETWQQLSKSESDAIIADLDQPLDIVVDGSSLVIFDKDQAIGSLKMGKTRIALRQLERLPIADVFVEDAALALGADPNRVLLARHLDAEDMFTILFSDLTLAYVDGSMFRDDALVGGGTAFMRHLLPINELATATSEKGEFAAGQDDFAQGSVFRVVVDHVASDDVLICDDLGDEWADFIGVSTQTAPAMISFYHAKHGSRSLSASMFHDAIGQGIKNLGRLTLAGDMMVAKYESWEDVYRNGGAETAISRYMRGGDRADVESKIGDAAGAPDVLRRVFIVTSSLSRTDVAECFARAANGQPLRPNFVQLYWILTGFFSACTEIGAIGYIVCQP
ncbi:MAG: hypothetical protein EOS54_03935 [Mesorhizobium sp.]|uniref:hypothetical protein n=1 Tax=Mesorhizobium sp. TaxID=1871066 RepID=UPI000FE576F8|nr:hypothetical protein [Mesorhizobium sp.]RWC57892.1 MAG: hypothetical protein EOS54_03935 [Mesorhizobium sp.]